MWWNKKEPNTPEKASKTARFGTYFRTACFEQHPLHRDDGSYAKEHAWKEYHEAHQLNGSPFLWSISKIKIENENGDTLIKSRPQVENLTFMEALERLAQYENFQKSQYPDQSPDAEIKELGTKHFKAFALREGILWDKEQTPHILKHPDALPQGQFHSSDVAVARETLAATPEFSMPVKNNILSEIFSAATSRSNVDLALHGLQCLNITNRFASCISSLAYDLSNVCSDPLKQESEIQGLTKKSIKLWPRSSALIHSTVRETYSRGLYRQSWSRPYGWALQRIDTAAQELQELKKEGKDITSLTEMLYICEMATHLLYAQALLNVCRNSPGLAKMEAPVIQTALDDAERIYTQHMNMETRALYESLKQNVASGETPRVPDFIKNFADEYAENKARAFKAGPRP